MVSSPDRSAAERSSERSRVPLRQQIKLGFALGQLVPLFVLGFVGGLIFVRSQEARAEARLLELATGFAQRIDTALVEHQRGLELAAEVLSESPDAAAMQSWLSRFRARQPTVLTMIAADPEGRIVAASPASLPDGSPVVGLSVADRPYFRIAFEQQASFVSGVFRGRGFDDDLIVAVSAPLEVGGAPAGVIEASLAAQDLTRPLFDALALRGAEMVITDGGGRVVAASAASGVAVLDPLAAEWSEKGFVTRRAKGEAFGWTVALRWPLSDVHGATRYFLIVAGIVVVLAVLTSAVLARALTTRAVAPLEHLTRRISSLASALGTSAEGDAALAAIEEHAARARPVSKAAPREVAVLVESFDHMVDDLAGSYLRQAIAVAERDVAVEDLETIRRELEDRVRARTHQLAMSEARFRGLVEQSFGLIGSHSVNGRILSINSAGAAALGYTPEELIGRRLESLLISGHTELAEQMAELPALGAAEGTIHLRTRQGEPLVMLYRNRWIGDADPPYVVVQALDITERARSEAAMRHRALHDPLTGCANRDLFGDRLDLALRQSERSTVRGDPHSRVALLYLDLDGFKPINDTLGHEVGDQVLIEVSRRLARAVRSTDTVARVGGDEFAIVLAGVDDREAVEHLGRQLVEAIGQPIPVGAQTVRVSASVGLALAPDDAVDAEALVREADAAMYRVKRGGGDGVGA